ncbi:hypothetical protein SARC_15072 [Sphaeroforma arctica JP610]|uniref:Anaphase-promoting complex subunit 4 WD40 domain-containing protein n=1 Tax=Sphaeroforma arctica JP610 TaxID=667725 RepID=A0A0L0F720_9EUKA|nr:hypothetical protein SARC_15072 [Sphaeroforma arctica JP610]KNC72371.1 hypothetical protein SARC_15072 [Sphaeroforma arctica JP610]|eukprot:XP_014146273.1 hypothetical protein SARC_15072 [Sphaeroforma arctica JP610]
MGLVAYAHTQQYNRAYTRLTGISCAILSHPTGHLLKTLAIDEKLGDACVSQDGRYLVTGGNNGCVVVRLVDNLSIIHVYEAMAPAIRSLAISSCERWIYAGADDGALTLYKTAMPHWHMVALTRLS